MRPSAPCTLGLFLLIAVIALEGSRAFGQDWSPPLEVPDYRGTGGDVGTHNSMAMVDGKPTIVSFDQAHKRIIWMRALDAAGTAWGAPRMLFDAQHCGQYMSLAVVNGHPAIAYQSWYEQDLLFARALDPEGLQWAQPVVVDSATNADAMYASLEILNGQPAIAYRDPDASKLTYIRALDADGNTWGAPLTVDNTWGTGMHACLRVVNGRPAIAYSTGSFARYKRAADEDGAVWGSHSDMNNGGDIRSTSLRVIGGVPCVGYFDDSEETVLFAHANDADGTTWAGATYVDGGGSENLGTYAQLLEAGGTPLLMYMDQSSTDLLGIRATDVDGTAWAAPQVLASAGSVGEHIAVATVDGNPAAVCYDASRADLLYVRATTTDGTGAWSDPINMDSNPLIGQYVSQAIVEGHPALAYWCSSDSTLRYIRSTDSTGTTWSTSVDVDSSAPCGQHVKLTVVNGLPMAVYHRSSGQTEQLVFARANNPLGTSWTAPIVLADSVSDVRSVSFTSVGGHPAVLCNLNAVVGYMRALDANGAAWPDGFTLNVPGMEGTALLDLDGVPFVVYSGGSQLRTRRGNDADGTTWTPIVVAVPPIFPLGYPSASIVGGHPAISFSGSVQDLYYVRSSDSLGNTWSPQVNVYTSGDHGRYSSLMEIDGRPAISFHSNLNAIHYVRANDATGTTWPLPARLDPSADGKFTALFTNGPYALISYYHEDREYPYFITGLPCTTPPPAPADDTPPQSLTICAGDSTTLIATGEGMITWHSESVGGILLGSGNTFPTGPILANTTYYARDSTCLTSSTRLSITVSVQAVDVGVAVSAGSLSANLANGTYQWLDCGNGLDSIAGATEQVFAPLISGSYAVEVSDGTCTAVSDCYAIIISSVEQASKSPFRMWPVPASTLLTLEGASPGDAFTLRDIGGRILLQGLLTVPRMNIPVGNLSSGSYLLHVRGMHGTSVLRFVVSRD